MVENISNFAITIVCTVMMIVIIKMIIPDGKNKKYILFVCGLITTLVMMEPILKFMNLDINEVLAKNEFEFNEYKADESLYKDTIKDSYEQALINDVINRLKENGYSVNNVRVEYDEATYKPTKIYLNLADGDGYVQPIKIEVSNNVSNSKIDDKVKNKIVDIIKNNYGINTNQIFINKSVQ